MPSPYEEMGMDPISPKAPALRASAMPSGRAAGYKLDSSPFFPHFSVRPSRRPLTRPPQDEDISSLYQ